MNRIFLCIMIAVVTFGCGNAPKQSKDNAIPTTSWNPPAAGTVVAKYEERFNKDNLNEAYFRVIVRATDSSKSGHFAVEMDGGENKNETEIDLPKWTPGSVLKPVLKKGDSTYECLLGFDAGDGQFKDLYLIKADDKKSITMKQIKGYYQQ